MRKVRLDLPDLLLQLLPERLRDACFLHVRYDRGAAPGPVGGVVDRRASELEWFLVGVCSLCFEEGTACLFFVPLVVAVAPLVAVVPFVDLFFCIISVLLFLLAPLPPEDGKDTFL